MNRHYDQEKYLERVRKLKEEIPEIAISTDIIVGYPTETEEDFKETLKVCDIVGYDTAYTFKYSPRPKTRAAKLTPLDDDVIQDRFDRLLDVLYPHFYEKNKTYIGKTVEVLLESESKNNPEVLTGRTDDFKLVHVKADKSLIGEFVKVKINDNTSFTISGDLVE